MTICNDFPWARYNHTLHGAIQHSAELIEMNLGLSVGWQSEEDLEANNKDIRNYLETSSKKCDGLLERSFGSQCPQLQGTAVLF